MGYHGIGLEKYSIELAVKRKSTVNLDILILSKQIF